MFNGSSILITGGTGTLGQACTKAILKDYKPKRLIIFSRDEQKHYEMAQQFTDDCMRFFVGDVRDYDRVNQACQNINYIIHAAAMKHVDIAEFNPSECIKTNVTGTENIIKTAVNNDVTKVILASTDKAVNPVSLYGSTKLSAEKLFISANSYNENSLTRFSVVRLGNIANSIGSVLPHFRKLIKEGAEYLPLTDSKMTRFWISAEQCAEFILDCFSWMRGQEIFIPKMPSIYISDLIEALGKPCKIIGMRPGEKLIETICPKETADITYSLTGYYLIVNERSILAKVPVDFEYNSLNNPDFLGVEEIRELIKE